MFLLHGGGQTRHAWKGAGQAWTEDGVYESDDMVKDLVAVHEA